MTTHVICEKCNEVEYKEYKKYQNVHVISKDWIIESLKYKRKVLEEDYLIQPIRDSKKPVKFVTYNSDIQGFESYRVSSSNKLRIEGLDFTFTQNSKKPKNNFFDSMETKVGSNQEAFSGLPTLKKSRSMNPKISNFKTEMKNSKDKNEIKFKSLLFKNYFFFFPKDSKGMSAYKRMALENSGSIVTDLKRVKIPAKKKIFGIFKDGDFDEKSVLRYKPFKDKMMVLSYRYILFCIEKRFVVEDPVKDKLIHLLPFPKKVYSENFKKVKIFIKGFDLEKSSSLNKTASILGFDVVDEEGDAHVVVLDPKSYGKLNKKIREEFPGVFMKESWLISCLTNGKLSDRSKKKLNAIKDFGFLENKDE